MLRGPLTTWITSMGKWIVASSSVTFGYTVTYPLERLQAAGCEVRLNPYGRPLTGKEMLEFAGDADALILGNDDLPAEVIRGMKKLKIISRYGVGFDGVDIREARIDNILVTAAPTSNREETADFEMGLILDLMRHITPMVSDMKDGVWKKRPGKGLYSKTMGIIGVGQVGTALARRAMGFGMDVLGYDIVQRNEPTVYGLIYTELNDLLRRSDVICINVPLNDSTRNMIGAREIRLMKHEAILVNISRAKVIREDALEKALTRGDLWGYATDVYGEEPPKHRPYFEMDNVLVTPHVAGLTFESSERMGNVVVDNVLAAKDGYEPPDLVGGRELYASTLGRYARE